MNISQYFQGRQDPIGLMQLRFVGSGSAFSYFDSTRRYLEEHGEPVAFYSDAMGELNIDIPCANTPQADRGIVSPTNAPSSQVGTGSARSP